MGKLLALLKTQTPTGKGSGMQVDGSRRGLRLSLVGAL
jgi:hypothetical protein